MTKMFLIKSQFKGMNKIFQAKSERQAVLMFVKDITAAKNPKLAKMYIDSKKGTTFQTGYIFGSYWLSVFELLPMMKKV